MRFATVGAFGKLHAVAFFRAPDVIATLLRQPKDGLIKAFAGWQPNQNRTLNTRATNQENRACGFLIRRTFFNRIRY